MNEVREKQIYDYHLYVKSFLKNGINELIYKTKAEKIENKLIITHE